ncbi:hypothetical protein CHCC20335_1678 [Bacillus paralicheniformis]|nr:hypothetical protein CHCC20335_1678 [Bacillus paralicheniformis]
MKGQLRSRHTDPNTTFQDYLKTYIDRTRGKRRTASACHNPEQADIR